MKIKNIKTEMLEHKVIAKTPTETGEYDCPICGKTLTVIKSDGLNWIKSAHATEHERYCEFTQKHNFRVLDSCHNCKFGGFDYNYDEMPDIYCNKLKEFLEISVSSVCDLYEQND